MLPDLFPPSSGKTDIHTEMVGSPGLQLLHTLAPHPLCQMVCKRSTSQTVIELQRTGTNYITSLLDCLKQFDFPVYRIT